MKRSKVRRSTKRHSRKRLLSSKDSRVLMKRSFRLSKKQRRLRKRLSRQINTRLFEGVKKTLGLDEQSKLEKEIKKTVAKMESDKKNTEDRIKMLEQKVKQVDEFLTRKIQQQNLIQAQLTAATNEVNSKKDEKTSYEQELKGLIKKKFDLQAEINKMKPEKK